jgi:[ribosomal protein S18]-alanine N-acetyltransferase
MTLFDSRTGAGAAKLAVAGPDDLALLVNLHKRCFKVSWTAETLAELMAAPGAFCLIVTPPDDLTDDPREAPRDAPAPSPVGFILARSIAGEAEILTIGVIPEARDRGLARRLLNATLERAARSGAAAIFLEVGTNNRAARRLYAGAGFFEVGRRRNYYPDEGAGRDDALVMRRDLVP